MRLIAKSMYCVLLMLGLIACGDDSSSASNAESQTTTQALPESTDVVDGPTYNVATISTFTPFIFRDERGQTIGFDVDILKAIGKKEGFNVVYLVVPWEGIFDTIRSGSHDILSSAVVITPERQQLVDFSNPYIDSGRMAVVKQNLKDRSIEELANLKFVTQGGTSNIPILESLVTNPDNIITVPTQFLEIQKVLLGEADVAFDDSRVMQYYVAQYPELHGVNFDAYPGDQFGFGVKKGRRDLLNKINQGLAKIKADGTYEKIYQKWFGVSPNQ